MSDYDVRRALATYADSTPYLDPKAGLNDRIARRAQQRRAAIAGTAAGAMLIAGTGVMSLTRNRDTTAVVASDPTESPFTESPSPEGSATPSPDAPTPSTQPSETPHGSASAARPGPPIVRTASGRHGLRVKTTFSHGSLPTATEAGLKIEAEDDDGYVLLYGLVWGDGTYEEAVVPLAVCPQEVHRSPQPTTTPLLPPSPQPSPTQKPMPHDKVADTYDKTWYHAWRNPGSYTVKVVIKSVVPCDEDDPQPDEESTVTFPVHVTPGAVTSNGPARPEVTFGEANVAESETPQMTVNGSFFDRDGYVGSVVIDWGDGSADSVITADGGCHDDEGKHYPHSLGSYSFSRDHPYKAGTYTVTFTVVSKGCDGGEPQRATTTATVEADYSDASPEP